MIKKITTRELQFNTLLQQFKLKGFLVILVGLIALLSGCKTEEPVIITSDYLILVNDVYVQEDEVMVYVYQVVEVFEQLGGKDVWEFEDFSDGKSAIEVAKDAVLDNVVRMKVLNEKAKELNIELSEEQLVVSANQATEFYASMSNSYKVEYGITADLVEQVFIESALAGEVAREVTVDFVPNESLILEQMQKNEDYMLTESLDPTDVLTELSIRHIYVSVFEENQEGDYVSLTEEQKEVKYELALDAHQLAEDGVDFESLVEGYSDRDDGLIKYSKAFLPEEYRDSLITLAEGEVSNIIEDDQGYHIFKVVGVKEPTEQDIATLEASLKEFQDELRLAVIEEQKEEAFNSFYEAWEQDVVVRLDKDMWSNINLDTDLEESDGNNDNNP